MTLQSDATYIGLKQRLAADRMRLRECFVARGVPVKHVRLTPSFLCVFLYRIARYLYQKGWRLSSRFIWQMNMFLTGADISPISNLGPGLLIIHPIAVTIVGTAGENLLVEGLGGMGGGLDMDDIGAGPGLPVLGHNVSMARGGMVLGPIRVGDNVIIGPGCTVVREVAANSEILAHKNKIIRDKNIEDE